MRVVYDGPSRTIDGVKRGGELELSEGSIAVLRAAGHKFTPVDKRRNLPEPEAEAFEAPVVEVEEQSEGEE